MPVLPLQPNPPPDNSASESIRPIFPLPYLHQRSSPSLLSLHFLSSLNHNLHHVVLGSGMTVQSGPPICSIHNHAARHWLTSSCSIIVLAWASLSLQSRIFFLGVVPGSFDPSLGCHAVHMQRHGVPSLFLFLLFLVCSSN